MFEQYKAVVGHAEHAEQLLGKESFEPDRMLLAHGEKTGKTVSQNEQAFNWETGLDVLIDLDDAARNTALCTDQAATAVLNDMNNLHPAVVGASPKLSRRVEATPLGRAKTPMLSTCAR